MGAKNRKKEKITELSLLLVLLVISFFLWDTYLIYPIKLCAVLLHEISHALAAVITGGKIIEMNIGFDLGGRCETEGGNNLLIASTGYLGSLFWGLLIFLSPNGKKYGLPILISVSAIILIAAIGLASGATIAILALMLSSLLIGAGFYIRIPIVSILIRAFGMISCVYVLFDIKEDLLSGSYELSDASLLSSITDIPATIVGLSWAVISVIGIYAAVRFSYRN